MIRQVLLENAGNTLHQYRDFFKADFTGWLGKEGQLDDMLVSGIEAD